MHVVEEAEHAVAVASDHSTVQSPGATVTYTVDVTNNGNVSDIFVVSAASSAGWAVTVSDPALLLNPGETGTVTVVVQVPANTEDGDVDVTTVTATSIYDASATDSVTLTTTVSDPPTVFYIFLPYVSNEQ